MDRLNHYIKWFIWMAVMTACIVYANSAQADGEWYETQTIGGEYTLALRGVKVRTVSANSEPYEDSVLLCVDKAKDTYGLAPEICTEHDGKSYHFLIPTGFTTMVRLAMAAMKDNDRVNLHVNTDPASVGMIETAGGRTRCYVSRIAWLDK